MLGPLRSSDVYLLPHNGSSSAECSMPSRITLKIQPPPITTHSLNYRTVLEHETPAKPRLQQSLPAPWRMLASPLSPSPKLTALENYPPPPNALDNSSPRVLLLHSLPPAGNHTHFPLRPTQGYKENTSCVG